MAVPEYLTGVTFAGVLARLEAAAPAGMDVSEGSFLGDALRAAAVEFVEASIRSQVLLEYAFPLSYPPRIASEPDAAQYLDLRATEAGLTRRPAVAATGEVTFTGTPGTVIPAGTVVSTLAAAGVPARHFTTDADAAIEAGGAVTADVTATEAGAAGNAAAGTVLFVGGTIAGVTGVVNAAAMTGGLDAESDASLRDRILFRLRNPSASGNVADYVVWSTEVPGIGAATVVPVWDGPGTVKVCLIGSDGLPVTNAKVDEVQLYVAPPWTQDVPESELVLSGFGASVDAVEPGSAVRFDHHASGPGVATHPNLDGVLPVSAGGIANAGIWQVRARLRVSDVAGVADLFEIGVWNLTTGAWSKKSSSAADARRVLAAEDMATTYASYDFDFYWNGTDDVELRATRLAAGDVTTTVWLDEVLYSSTFSRDTGDGKAPIGARVTVESALAVPVDVEVSILYADGYDPLDVRVAVEDAIADYVASLALRIGSRDVQYARIGNAILNVPGVDDYTGLLLNGTAGNVAVGTCEVAVMGVITALPWDEFDAHGMTWNEWDALQDTWASINLEPG